MCEFCLNSKICHEGRRRSRGKAEEETKKKLSPRKDGKDMERMERGNLISNLNLLTPTGDSHVTSPYNIHALSSKQVMRIFICIR